jgi:hypothetical protein
VWITLRSGPYAIADAPVVALLLAAAGAVGLTLVLAGRPSTAMVLFASAFVALNYLIVTRVLPQAEQTKPVPPIAKVLEERASPGSRLGAHNMMLPSLVFYANRSVKDLTEDEAAAWLSSSDEVWVVTGSAEWEALRARVPSACVVLQRTLFPFDRVKPDTLFNQEAPPDVLLVSNKCR